MTRPAPIHVLVVDDEIGVTDLVRGYLASEGFVVSVTHDGNSALDLARHHKPDVVVLDVMMPGLDGIEVCRQLRQFSDAYVLMLTSRSEEVDRVVGLSVGADDYVTKPFSPRELVARVKALMRRPRTGNPSQVVEPTVIRIGSIVIDDGSHEVRLREEVVPLTAREFSLCLALATHPGRVFTRAQLLEGVWGDEYYDDHVVDVHIANLRKKLEDDPAHPRYVETVRGVGYRFTKEAE